MATSAPEWQEFVDKEQIKMFFQVVPSTSAIALVVTLASASYLWGSILDDEMINWVLLSLLVFGFRIGIWVFYRQSPFWFKKSISWGRLGAVGIFMYGALWGYAVAIFDIQGNIENLLFVALIVTTTATGVAVFASNSYLPAIYAFLIPPYVSTIIVFGLLSESSIDVTLVFLGIIYFITIISLARKSHANFTESLILRYQLDARKKETEHANLAKSKYLAAASHDLRQPLHAITLFASLLEERVSDPGTKNVVAQLQNSVDGLSNLFNALLDISKLDAGIINVNNCHFGLQSLFTRLQGEFSTVASDKHLNYLADETDEYVHTDSVLLESILRNLLANAMRYTDIGSVELKCLREQKTICIKVIDSGKGIPPDSIDEIFEEFFQLHNPERDRSKGLGLGLSIVRRLSELLGYTINITSVVGKGTEFTLRVPIGEKSLTDSEHQQPVSVIQKSLKDLYVIIIENEKRYEMA